MIARRVLSFSLASLCAVVCSLAFVSVAFAAPPQAPETDSPTEVTETTAMLHGLLNPLGSEKDGWYFAYNIGSSCTGGATTPLEPELEQFFVPVQTTVTGLTPNAKYAFCLVERNEAGEVTAGNAVSFTAKPEAPIVEEESFSNVGSASATLNARINPEGTPSTYYFEYGTSAAYGSRTAVSSLGFSVGGVQATLGGLTPDTVYHFRVVTTNSSDQTSYGSDVSFSTFPVGILSLPDERGYEIVTSLDNGDASVVEPHGLGDHERQPGSTEIFQAAAGGDALAYIGTPPNVGGNGSVGDGMGNEYLARRSAAGAWTAASIQPAGLKSPAYQGFSSDLTLGVFDSNEALTANAPGEKYDVLYTRTASSREIQPFFTSRPPNRASSEFRAPNVNQLSERIAYAGASSDMSHLLFEANDALTPGAVDGGPIANNLYETLGGQVRLVNVLPDGKPDPNATFGSSVSAGGSPPQPDFDHVISADGSRIFWTDLNTGALYVRENGTTTVQVDASRGPGSSGGGLFLAATADGSKVFFTDEKQLTNDSTAAPEAPDLYEYDVQEYGLIDLSVAEAGEHADVRGVLGISADGSYVYFAAGGSLAGGATRQTCEETGESLCNIYVVHGREGPKPIATVLYKDGGIRGAGGGVAVGDWQYSMGARAAWVTPDGQHLVFASARNLTGYESEGTNTEIYTYDFASGGLSCISCNPSGAPTITGSSALGSAELRKSYSNTYNLRDVSENGDRVFFDSLEALVLQDTNGRVDVYEWERDGSGGCRREKGCLYLLSGGTSVDSSFFLDASATGDDVFISTRAQLVREDQNEVFDAYDVRVGAPEPATPPACTGSGCQGVPGAPPIFATPSSVTFGGVGNFSGVSQGVVKAKPRSAKCRRGFVRKRGRCVRKKAGKPGRHNATRSGIRSSRRGK
jgi:hypothetical protein